MDNLPIDIQSNKLVEWLISRRHCNIKWQASNEVVKSKITSAVKDMPSTDEMKKLLEGSCFHYYKCKKIVDVLKDTEKDSKNIFGMYSSQRMKDWQQIVSLYEKENLYLAELSSRMLRNVNYEIPENKKQIAKCAQVQKECEKKMKDCDRRKLEVERTYERDCKKIGISGKNVRKEILDLASDIDQDFDKIAEMCKDLNSAVKYYVAFVRYTTQTEGEFDEEVCPVTKHLGCHGNTTVYQLKHGKVPDKVVLEDKFEKFNVEPEDTGNEIDWGFDDVAANDDVIDFGIEEDFGGITLEEDGVMETEDFGGIVVEEEKVGDNFTIVDSSDIQEAAEHAKEEFIIASGEDAESVLGSKSTRTQFINELIELRAFLNQRVLECSQSGDGIDDVTSPVIMTSQHEIEDMLMAVDDVHSGVTNTKMTYLCRIIDSPKFVDRKVEQLKKLKQLASKHDRIKTEIEAKREESVAEEKQLYPKQKLLVKETKEWKLLVEKAISSLYKQRRVNLMGQINFI